MAKIIENPEYLSFDCEEGGRFSVHKSNRGEPYRDVVDLDIYLGEYDHVAGVALSDHEARKLRDLLNRIYP